MSDLKAWKVAMVAGLFLTSLAAIYWQASNLTAGEPDASLPPPPEQQPQQQLRFPLSLAELRQTSSALAAIKERRPWGVLALFASTYVFKQAFSIPGSVFLNLLAGSLYTTPVALALTSALTGAGATGAVLLGRAVGRGVAIRLAPRRTGEFKRMLEDNSHRLPYWLLSLRLFPGTPNWAINLCSGVLGVPLPTFFATVVLGLLPYNYLCVQAGSLLSSLEDTSDIVSPSNAAKLVTMSAVAVLAPILGRRYLQPGPRAN